VFVTLGQKLDTDTRHQYLREQAGKSVGGAGHLEAVMPRTYFDTLGGCPRIGVVARKWRSEAKLAYVRGE
jgi:hypothetical protein